MGVKTSKYFKVISIIDEDNQEHYGILVERIHDSVITKLGCLPVPEGRVTHKTLSDIQNLLQKFEQHPNLSISDLQMLLGRDGQLLSPLYSLFFLPENNQTKFQTMVSQHLMGP
jgi:hypothetical protein